MAVHFYSMWLNWNERGVHFNAISLRNFFITANVKEVFIKSTACNFGELVRFRFLFKVNFITVRSLEYY